MPNFKDEKSKQLFNWGEISRLFSGTRSVIRKNSIPKVHQPIINEMIEAVGDILKSHGIIKPVWTKEDHDITNSKA